MDAGVSVAYKSGGSRCQSFAKDITSLPCSHFFLSFVWLLRCSVASPATLLAAFTFLPRRQESLSESKSLLPRAANACRDLPPTFSRYIAFWSACSRSQCSECTHDSVSVSPKLVARGCKIHSSRFYEEIRNNPVGRIIRHHRTPAQMPRRTTLSQKFVDGQY